MSTADPRYSIDTCSLTAMARIYPRDVFPGAWAKLESLVNHGILLATELVQWELEAQDDDLNQWSRAYGRLFRPLDEPTQEKARAILASHGALVDFKKRKSAGADPFVIALAALESLTVVTEERPSGGPHTKKIPDVCRAEGIECIAVLEMLRREGLRL
jgi:hypothetical protein